jgi:hypothetical protein
MTTTQASALTREQVLTILKSSYCLINNWGGARYHYMPYFLTDPNADFCTLFENDTGKSYKFSLESSKTQLDGNSLQLINIEDNLPYSFTVLTKLNLQEFSSSQ